MRKLLKKIMPVVVLSALIVLVGGFCDGLIASAQIGTDFSKMNQLMDGVLVIPVAEQTMMNQGGMPLNDGALRPCCVDRHNSTPTLQVGNFNAGVKFAAIDSALASANLDSFFENKISDISDPSPPKPDILSSILRLE